MQKSLFVHPCTTCCNILKFYVFPRSLYMSLVWFSLKTVIISLKKSNLLFDECLSVHRRNKGSKPTRCYTLFYWTCNLLNMFRARLCPSSGARDYTASMACGVWFLVAGGRKVRCKAPCYASGVRDAVRLDSWLLVVGRSGARHQVMSPGWGMLFDWVEQHQVQGTTGALHLTFRPPSTRNHTPHAILAAV